MIHMAASTAAWQTQWQFSDFPIVPPADYLAAILGDSRDALNRELDDPTHAILNACRVFAFMAEGLICSKQEGAEWALLAKLPAGVRPAVERALDYYMNDVDDRRFDGAVVDKFVAYMRETIFQDLASPATGPVLPRTTRSVGNS